MNSPTPAFTPIRIPRNGRRTEPRLDGPDLHPKASVRGRLRAMWTIWRNGSVMFRVTSDYGIINLPASKVNVTHCDFEGTKVYWNTHLLLPNEGYDND